MPLPQPTAETYDLLADWKNQLQMSYVQLAAKILF